MAQNIALRDPHLPIHCNLIHTCCSAIQTLLQLNSNNYTGCAFLELCCSGGISRNMAEYGGIWRYRMVFYRVKIRRNSTWLCGIDLQCCGIRRR